MQQETEDRPNHIPWPPLIYALGLAAAWLLEHWLPLPGLPESLLLRCIGGVVLLGGIGLAIVGYSALSDAGTTFDPAAAATALVTEGIYGWTRNPMYLGALAAIGGLGLALRSSWLLVLVPVAAAALTKLAIEPEEAYLERRFGPQYGSYKARVRRWI